MQPLNRWVPARWVGVAGGESSARLTPPEQRVRVVHRGGLEMRKVIVLFVDTLQFGAEAGISYGNMQIWVIVWLIKGNVIV